MRAAGPDIAAPGKGPAGAICREVLNAGERGAMSIANRKRSECHQLPARAKSLAPMPLVAK